MRREASVDALSIVTVEGTPVGGGWIFGGDAVSPVVPLSVVSAPAFEAVTNSDSLAT